MAITAGTPSLLTVTANSATVTSTPATGGTSPYAYQWHKSVTSGFTPSGGTLIPGATTLTYTDNGLYPLTTFYYKLVSVDEGHSNDTVVSVQLPVVTTQPTLSMNQFAISEVLGSTDLRLNTNTVSVQVDATQETPIYAGQAVTFVDSAGGVPKVVACDANTDEVYGFVNYSTKRQWYTAGMSCEISQTENCIYLTATAPIARGVQVQLNVGSVGGVAAAVGSSGASIVGYAYDKATAPGQLIRVKVWAPSFTKA